MGMHLFGSKQHEGKDSHDGKTGSHNADHLQMQEGHTQHHADDVGNKPDEPYHGAKRMKALSACFAAAEVGKGCPRGVYEHEDNGKKPGEAMD